MIWIVAGLGNPGSEYVGTRHNVGREFLEALAKKDWIKNLPAGRRAKIILPDTYMNNSGVAIKKALAANPVRSSTSNGTGHLVVLHDDLDLALGSVKISFGSGSGGHKGVESVQKALKTKDFVRIRIGISPATPGGMLKKPGSTQVNDFVLGKFRSTEQEKLKKVRKTVAEALDILFADGRAAAMNAVNTKRR